MRDPGASSAVSPVLSRALILHLDEKEKLALLCLGTKPLPEWAQIQERAPCLPGRGLLNLGALHCVRPGPTGSSARERAPPTLAPKCSLLPDISSWASLGPLTETAAKP